MSITVAVNATDSANGPQAVCQSVQHNCAEYNGNDDMAVFDHEKDQQEQVDIIVIDLLYRRISQFTSRYRVHNIIVVGHYNAILLYYLLI